MELYRKLYKERPQKCRLITIRHMGFKLRGAARHFRMYAIPELREENFALQEVRVLLVTAM